MAKPGPFEKTHEEHEFFKKNMNLAAFLQGDYKNSHVAHQ